MKSTLSRIVLPVVGAVLFSLTACEKDSLTSSSVEEIVPIEVATDHAFKGNSFQVKEGHVKFNSEKELFTMVRTMVNNYTEAAEYFTDLPDYSSSRAAYLELISKDDFALEDLELHSPLLYRFERDGESYVDHTIDDLGLEYLANAEGILEAGAYMYDLSDRDHPVKILSEAYTAGADVKTYQKGEAIPIELYRLQNSGFLKVDVRTCRKDFNGNSNRITGQLERSHIFGSFGFLWNFNVRTRFFRKRLGIWVGVQADRLNSEWDLWINVDTNGQGSMTETRFRGSHIANSGDRQNTRAIILEETTEASVYLSGREGLNRSRNIAEDRGARDECNCGL